MNQVKLIIKHIPYLYLITLFVGSLFFIPAIFVNRITTSPSLWIQGGISMGILIYVFFEKRWIPFPPKYYILLMTIWTIYHLVKNQSNIENMIKILTFNTAFYLFYIIWSRLKDKNFLFTFFLYLALVLSLWGLLQFTGLLPSYNGSFTVTGPFDNPAGISASLALLLPFSLYGCLQKKQRIIAIIVVCLIVIVIILTQARAAVLAILIILIFFFIRIFKEQNIKLLPVHYTAISISCFLLFACMFFIKKDSASGRLLIWRCSAQLISSKPVYGYGGNGFYANYMNEQAEYFTRHPKSKYSILADNVRHPFNEFLNGAVNYGFVGLGITLLLIIIPLWDSRKNNSPELFFIRLSLLSIGVCAFFSYPLNYPFIRLMTVILLTFILVSDLKKSITIKNGCLTKGISLLLSLGLLSGTTYQFFYEYEWHKIAHRSLRGATEKMLPRYKSLYTHLHHKDLFLYNYAAELNVEGHFVESQKIAHKCDSLWADYDLQMLMADNCLQLQQYDATRRYLKKAATMCPVKFMPLYRLVELYLETEQNIQAQTLAQKIIDKEVKITSPVINSIKNKMRKLLNEPEIWDDVSQTIR